MKRRVSFAILCAIIPLGIATKHYAGPLEEWVARYGGDVASPMFFFFLALLVRPRLRPAFCALGVLAFCAVVELSQAADWAALEIVRRNPAGRTLIGSDFDPLDFLFYVAGVSLSLVLCRAFSSRPGRAIAPTDGGRRERPAAG